MVLSAGFVLVQRQWPPSCGFRAPIEVANLSPFAGSKAGKPNGRIGTKLSSPLLASFPAALIAIGSVGCSVYAET